MNFIQKLRKKLSDTFKKNKGASIICLGISGYFLYKYLSHETPEVLLSSFIRLVNNKTVAECVIQGHRIYFKPQSSDAWFFVNASMLTKERMFNLLLKSQDIKVSNREGGGLDRLLSLGVSKLSFLLFGILTFFQFLEVLEVIFVLLDRLRSLLAHGDKLYLQIFLSLES